jgi:hypothetical protein
VRFAEIGASFFTSSKKSMTCRRVIDAADDRIQRDRGRFR